ncbi:MAG: sugar phosphate isomerase/epimerase family protein [Patescibacteria group bacterium]
MPRSFRFAICNELWGNRPIEDVFVEAKMFGYDAIEIAPFIISKDVTEISDARRNQIRLAAEVSKLKIVGLHWLLKDTEGMHISDPDKAVRDRTSGYLVELVRFCHDIGGDTMVFGSPQQRSIKPDVEPDRARTLSLHTLKQAVRVGADLGVMLCIEPLSPDQTNFLTTAEEAAAFADNLEELAGHPVRIILDCYSMRSEQCSRGWLIRRHAPILHHVHLNDLNMQGPGMAENGIDFTEVFAALIEIGYRGCVSVEAFDFSPGADVIATRSYQHLVDCYESVINR